MKWQKTATLPTGAFPPAKVAALAAPWTWRPAPRDRKSTRLNSSHSQISYAVFCLKKKNKVQHHTAADPPLSRPHTCHPSRPTYSIYQTTKQTQPAKYPLVALY